MRSRGILQRYRPNQSPRLKTRKWSELNKSGCIDGLTGTTDIVMVGKIERVVMKTYATAISYRIFLRATLIILSQFALESGAPRWGLASEGERGERGSAERDNRRRIHGSSSGTTALNEGSRVIQAFAAPHANMNEVEIPKKQSCGLGLRNAFRGTRLRCVQRAACTNELDSREDDSHHRLAGYQRLDGRGAEERCHGYHGRLKICATAG